MADYFHVGPWRWIAESGESYWGSPDGTLGLIDVRTIPQMSRAGGAPGAGIFVTDRPLNSDYTLLGKQYDDNLTSAHKSAWESLIGIRPESSRLVDALWETLTVKSDPRGETGPRPLIPTHLRRIEMHLAGNVVSRPFTIADPEWPKILEALQINYAEWRAWCVSVGTQHYLRALTAVLGKYPGLHYRQIQGDLPDEKPLPHDTIITDAFPYGDGAVGAVTGGNWVDVRGQFFIDGNEISGAVVSTGAFPAYARYSGQALSTDDQYAQIDFTTAQATRSHMCGAVRVAAAAVTCYAGINRAGDGRRELVKVITGGFTSLALDAGGVGPPHTDKVQAGGSTIKLFTDGAEIHSVTDSAISGNLYVGLSTHENSNYTSWGDNFDAADLYVPNAWYYYAQQ